MKKGNVLFSAVHFFTVFLILGMGTLVLALPYADTLRVRCLNVLADPGPYCSFIGGAAVLLGLLLFVAAYFVNRRGFLQIEMAGMVVDIDEEVVRECASSYFKERFPN